MDKVICVANVIDNCKLVLNVGENDGVKIGDRFLVYTNSNEDIVDPITKKSLGKLELVKGKGKVTHVQQYMCTIETLNTKEKTKKTVKDNNSLGFAILNYSFSTPSTTKTEEEVEIIPIPFENPKVGDLAKEI